MARLRIGYDLFAGSTQAGTDDGLTGNIQIETSQDKPYMLRIQRLADNWYWNNTSGAWQSGAPAEADELEVRGSRPQMAAVSAIRRLAMKLPSAVLAGIDEDGCVCTTYAEGDSPATGELVAITFKPTT